MAEEFENTSQDTQADVKGAGTMLAAPFEIARQDTLTEVQQTVNKTDTTIGDIGDPAGEESLVGLIKDIPEKVPTGAVKSVQRGHITAVKTGGVADVTINTVNPEKCICTVIGGYRISDFRPAVIKEFSSTKLKIITLGMTGESSQNVAIYWEVAEFY